MSRGYPSNAVLPMDPAEFERLEHFTKHYKMLNQALDSVTEAENVLDTVTVNVRKKIRQEFKQLRELLNVLESATLADVDKQRTNVRKLITDTTASLEQSMASSQHGEEVCTSAWQSTINWNQLAARKKTIMDITDSLFQVDIPFITQPPQNSIHFDENIFGITEDSQIVRCLLKPCEISKRRSGGAPPSSMTSLIVSNITDSQCQLSWNMPHSQSPISQYEIVELNTGSYTSIKGDKSSYVYSRLREQCTYRFQIRARNQSCWGSFGNIITITTAEHTSNVSMDEIEFVGASSTRSGSGKDLLNDNSGGWCANSWCPQWLVFVVTRQPRQINGCRLIYTGIDNFVEPERTPISIVVEGTSSRTTPEWRVVKQFSTIGKKNQWLDSGLLNTTYQYIRIRIVAVAGGSDWYPAFNQIQFY